MKTPDTRAAKRKGNVKARRIDRDIRVLGTCINALNRSTSRRMLNATVSFLVDHFITHPSREPPPHLQRSAPRREGRGA